MKNIHIGKSSSLCLSQVLSLLELRPPQQLQNVEDLKNIHAIRPEGSGKFFS